MKTALYLRVSSDSQNHNSQLHDVRRYCQLRGWTDTVEFVDTASGTRTDRTGLEALMEAVRAGKLERVVVYKLDRLGRSLAHLALVLHELQQRGVALTLGSAAKHAATPLVTAAVAAERQWRRIPVSTE